MALSLMSKKMLTTGQAAKWCSVTPDTILKWIKQGRIPATRTAGGHYRIRPEALSHLVPGGLPEAPASPRQYRFCWEFNSRETEGMQPECLACVVYRTRSYRCYEVRRLAPKLGEPQLFCHSSCDDCEYYRRVHRQPTNVLVVSSRRGLTAALAQEAPPTPMNLEVTDCEYACAALVESFRPDYVVIDCALGMSRSRNIVFQLKRDARLPFVRVILAAAKGEYPDGCDKEVFGRIETPFTVADVVRCISYARGEAAAYPADALTRQHDA